MIHKLRFRASATSLKIVKPCEIISQAFINHSAGSNLGGAGGGKLTYLNIKLLEDLISVDFISPVYVVASVFL